MAEKKMKIKLIEGCVIDGKNAKKNATVDVPVAVANLLIGAGTACAAKAEKKTEK